MAEGGRLLSVPGRPSPPGQDFTYTVRAQGRLATEEEFANIVLRATPDGSIVRVKDVARSVRVAVWWMRWRSGGAFGM